MQPISLLKATAITSGLTAISANAAVVQITLSNNRIATSINTLNADVTGDGNDDLTFSNSSTDTSSARVAINSNSVKASRFFSFISSSFTSIFRQDAQFALGGVGIASNAGSVGSITYLNPFTFTDARIRGGALTEAWLEITASNIAFDNQSVQLMRVIFDDSDDVLTRPTFASIPGVQTEWSAIPEPSSIALLALGAGGILARRRRNVA
jgi:hypothetical protein